MYHLQKRVFDADIISIKRRLTTLESENKTLKEKVKKQEKELKTYKIENDKREIEWKEALKEELEEEGLWYEDELKDLIYGVVNKVELKNDILNITRVILENGLKSQKGVILDEINEIKEKVKKQEKGISEIKDNQVKQNKRLSECIKTFATKETTDEIKNVTIANKRNIIAVASLWLQFAKTNVHIYDPVGISKMINKRRKEIREDVYRDMYKRELECKTLDELREKATKNKISEVDILDAIESPDDKEIKDGYECDMEEESKSKKCKKPSQKTSHDNLRELIINEKLKKLVYPKDQYRYRKVDDLKRTFEWKAEYILTEKTDFKTVSEALDKHEREKFPESYNEGFTLEAGYDDY